jgi:hypothetical protein
MIWFERQQENPNDINFIVNMVSNFNAIPKQVIEVCHFFQESYLAIV